MIFIVSIHYHQCILFSRHMHAYTYIYYFVLEVYHFSIYKTSNVFCTFLPFGIFNLKMLFSKKYQNIRTERSFWKLNCKAAERILSVKSKRSRIYRKILRNMLSNISYFERVSRYEIFFPVSIILTTTLVVW